MKCTLATAERVRGPPIRYDPHENVPFGDATEQNVEDLTEERESDDDVEIVFVDAPPARDSSAWNDSSSGQALRWSAVSA